MAEGTAAKPIRFTGGADEGSWDCVEVCSNTENRFAYCEFINGGQFTYLTRDNNGGVLWISSENNVGARASIKHCTVTGGLLNGISIRDGSNIDAFDHVSVKGVNDAPLWMSGSWKMLEKLDMTSDFTGNTNEYVEIGATYNDEEASVISKISVPYYFSEGLGYVNADLTINAGVTIYMSNKNLTPQSQYGSTQNTGTLFINGTEAEPVKITRRPGTTDRWGTFYVYGMKGSVIRNCIFEHGGASRAMVLVTHGADLTLENVAFNNSYSVGFGFYSSDNPIITDNGGCTFTGNAGNHNVADFSRSPVVYYADLEAAGL